MSILTQKKYGVYSITFSTEHGDMIYIGSTRRSFTERYNHHIADLVGQRHHNERLQRCWNKYKDTIRFEIIEYCIDPEIIISREQFFIEQVDDRYLLNMGPAYPNPMAGRHQSEEAKRKVSFFNKGRKHTEETKEKIRQAKLGKPSHPQSLVSRIKMSLAGIGKKHNVTPEGREAISKIHKGKIVSIETKDKLREANFGKHHTDESKKKMSQSQTGRQHTPETLHKMSIIQKIIKCDPNKHEQRSDAAKKSWETRRKNNVQCEEI